MIKWIPQGPQERGYRWRLGIKGAEGKGLRTFFPIEEEQGTGGGTPPPVGTYSPKCPRAFSILWEKLPHPSLSGTEFE